MRVFCKMHPTVDGILFYVVLDFRGGKICIILPPMPCYVCNVDNMVNRFAVIDLGNYFLDSIQRLSNCSSLLQQQQTNHRGRKDQTGGGEGRNEARRGEDPSGKPFIRENDQFSSSARHCKTHIKPVFFSDPNPLQKNQEKKSSFMKGLPHFFAAAPRALYKSDLRKRP